MADNVFTKIESPLLNSTGFANGLEDMIENINENFRKIATIPATKGETGDSMEYIRYNPNFLWYSLSKIYNELHDRLEDKISGLVAEANADFLDWCVKTGHDNNTTSKLAYWKEVREIYSDMVTAVREYFERDENDEILLNEAEELEFLMDGVKYKFHLAFLNILCGLERVYENGEQLIYDDVINESEFITLFEGHYQKYMPSTVTVFGKRDGDLFEKVGTLSYVFIDPRWRNTCVNKYVDLDDEKISEIKKLTDHTCVVYGSMDYVEEKLKFVYKVNDAFPRLKYGENGITMIINGQDTGMGATGAPGKDGVNANIIPVERMENINYDGISEEVTSEGLSSMWEIPLGVVTEKYLAGYTQPVPSNTNVEAASAGSLEASNDGSVDYVIQWPKVHADATYQKGDTISSGDGWLTQYPSGGNSSAWSRYTDSNISGGFYFRIWGIPGKHVFWKMEETVVNDETKTVMMPISDEDDSTAYNKLASLDGSACLVVPTVDFRMKHYNTIFWLSTIQLIPIRKKVGGVYEVRYIPVCYCGPDNMINCAMDSHSFAGLMQGLDVYEQRFNADAALSNKARGVMLPIGSKWTDMDNAKSAHIIYSDVPNDIEAEVIDWSAGVANNTGQYKAVANKSVLHIGSVVNFSALNDTATSDSKITAARPGRNDNDKAAFAATELHIDEPVRITMYRDTKNTTQSTLLSVEGDVVIGVTHSNDGKNSTSSLSHVERAVYGGLYIGSALSSSNSPISNGRAFGYLNHDNSTNDAAWGDWVNMNEDGDDENIWHGHINWHSDHASKKRISAYKKFRDRSDAVYERAALYTPYSIYANGLNLSDSIIIGSKPATGTIRPKFAVDRNSIYFNTSAVIGNSIYYQFSSTGTISNSDGTMQTVNGSTANTHRLGVGMAIHKGYAASETDKAVRRANPEYLANLGLNFFVKNLYEGDVPYETNPNGWYAQSDLSVARTFKFNGEERPVLSGNIWQMDQNDFRGGVIVKGWGYTNHSSYNRWRYGLDVKSGMYVGGQIISELPDDYIDGRTLNKNGNYYFGDRVLKYGDINSQYLKDDWTTGTKSGEQLVEQVANEFTDKVGQNMRNVMKGIQVSSNKFGRSFIEQRDESLVSMYIDGNSFSSGSLWLAGDLQVTDTTYFTGNTFATHIYTTKLWVDEKPSAIIMGQGNVSESVAQDSAGSKKTDSQNSSAHIINVENSPIVLDLGPEYGDKRLVKFALVDSLNVNGSDYNVNYAADPTKGKIFLGQWPQLNSNVGRPELLLSGFVGRWGEPFLNDPIKYGFAGNLTNKQAKEIIADALDDSIDRRLTNDGWLACSPETANALMNACIASTTADGLQVATSYRAVMWDYNGAAYIVRPQPVGQCDGNGARSNGSFQVAHGIMGIDVHSALNGCTITSMNVTEAGNGEENAFGLFYTHSDAARTVKNSGVKGSTDNINLVYYNGLNHWDHRTRSHGLEPGDNAMYMNWYKSGTYSGNANGKIPMAASSSTYKWQRKSGHICLSFTRIVLHDKGNATVDSSFCSCPGFWFQVYGIRKK